jgi:hypothetical protein
MTVTLPLLLLWALVGWCGIVYPPQLPPPPVPPAPGWFSTRLVNAIGAVIGGVIYGWFWPFNRGMDTPGMWAATSCVGAIIGAALLGDFVALVTGKGKKE